MEQLRQRGVGRLLQALHLQLCQMLLHLLQLQVRPLQPKRQLPLLQPLLLHLHLHQPPPPFPLPLPPLLLLQLLL